MGRSLSKSRLRISSITPAVRFGVWRAHGGLCFWCQEPISFKDCTIDHVIPKSAMTENFTIEVVRQNYKLPEDFEIESLRNWVPSHQRCNGTKNSLIAENSPALIYQFMAIGAKARIAELNIEKIEADKTKAKFLAEIESRVSKGTVSKEELLEFLEDMPEYMQRTAASNVRVLEFIDDWEILEGSDGVRIRSLTTADVWAAGIRRKFSK